MSLRIFLLLLVTLFASCSNQKEKPSYRPEIIDALAAFDIKLEEPKPGDWLDVHFEPGQSFKQYTESKPVAPSDVRYKIYLQPLGNFSTEELNLVVFTADYLRRFFDLQTVVLPVVSDTIVPPSARRILAGQLQLKTGFIMNYLQQAIPDDGIVMMAITPIDLYPSGDFNFVFGQARTKNRVGVSSFNRFMDGPVDSTNYRICLSRLLKTSAHEIGHMFTCLHCTHAVCLMNGTNSLSESDSRPNRLCSDCLRKLHWNLRFDVRNRLHSLRAYFSEHGLHADVDLTDRDLKALERIR